MEVIKDNIIFYSLFFIVIKIFSEKKDKNFKISIEDLIVFILACSIYAVLTDWLIENGIIEKELISGRRNPIGILLGVVILLPVHIVISIIKKRILKLKKFKKKYRTKKFIINKHDQNLKIKKEKSKRVTKEHIVKEYRKNNPNARKCDCIRETGLSKSTVYKWWD